jgi:uncharacterized protein YfeS
MDDELYGIDIEHASKKSIELIPEDFFWSCIDELGPFGSDEGDTALAEFRDWKKRNPTLLTIECLKWTIEGVGEMNFDDYNETLLSKEKIQSQIDDKDFDDQQYIFTLDISVIATGFGQLVDEGIIDKENKPTIKLALDRQIIWSDLQKDWEHAGQYIANLNVLKRALEQS